MGKHHMNVGVGRAQGKCVVCHIPFVGPGDRCQYHRDRLRQRKRRKPR
jgi:hypothetical protein